MGSAPYSQTDTIQKPADPTEEIATPKEAE